MNADDVAGAEHIILIGQSKQLCMCMLCADWVRSCNSLLGLLSIYIQRKTSFRNRFVMRRNTNCQQTPSKTPSFEGNRKCGSITPSCTWYNFGLGRSYTLLTVETRES